MIDIDRIKLSEFQKIGSQINHMLRISEFEKKDVMPIIAEKEKVDNSSRVIAVLKSILVDKLVLEEKSEEIFIKSTIEESIIELGCFSDDLCNVGLSQSATPH